MFIELISSSLMTVIFNFIQMIYCIYNDIQVKERQENCI